MMGPIPPCSVFSACSLLMVLTASPSALLSFPIGRSRQGGAVCLCRRWGMRAMWGPLLPLATGMNGADRLGRRGRDPSRATPQWACRPPCATIAPPAPLRPAGTPSTVFLRPLRLQRDTGERRRSARPKQSWRRWSARGQSSSGSWGGRRRTERGSHAGLVSGWRGAAHAAGCCDMNSSAAIAPCCAIFTPIVMPWYYVYHMM